MEYTLDQVNLPISKMIKDKIVMFNQDAIDSVAFKILSDNFNKSLFILVHGSEDGLICMNGTRLTAKDLLDSFVRAGMTSDEIENIFTISCYGGLQETYTTNGITISSIHDETKEVYYRLKSSNADDKYWLTLYTKEEDYKNEGSL